MISHPDITFMKEQVGRRTKHGDEIVAVSVRGELTCTPYGRKLFEPAIVEVITNYANSDI
eukprot:10722272-Karenia_brevis.AAC.1